MKRHVILMLVGLLGAPWLPTAVADAPFVTGLGSGSQFTLEAVDGGPAFGAAAVDGPAGTPNTLNAGVGFNYLHPLFSHRSVPLTVPAGASPLVGVIDEGNALTSSFAFVPRVDLNYDISSLGFGAAASAEFINLTGSLQRTLAVGGGSADLNASYNLTIINANLVELSKSTPLASLGCGDCVECLHLEDDVLGFTLGTRVSYIQQTYRATLTSAGFLSNAQGDQSFVGFGLTTSVADVHPLSDNWALYGRTRISLLIGPNNRKSVVTAVDPTSPAAAVNNNLIENKTTFLPVGEMELGVQYAAPVGAPAAAGAPQPIFFAKTGFVGQFWGDAGFVSAGPANTSFDERPFFLVGVTLTAGIQY